MQKTDYKSENTSTSAHYVIPDPDPESSRNTGAQRPNFHSIIYNPKSIFSRRRPSAERAFTIVELLIVIVIIGILATIVIVAYNGITKKAQDSVLQSDLKNASTTLEIANATDGSYPNDDSSLKSSPDTTFSYNYSSDDNSYCLEASSTKTTNTYFITSGGNIQAGTCTPVTPLTMQTMTSSYCSSMTVYTGSNPSALITLTDNRDGTTRSYTVGKLADNNCWMLDNLKLGSTTSSITLTPANSDVSANYTLPQVDTSPTGSSGSTSEYSTARVYSTVNKSGDKDTGTGDHNYGYLYSFTAATAGATTTSLPMGTGDAPDSICPAGWRLPTGRATTGDFAKLDLAFGGTGTNSSTQYAKWNYVGPFRGVLAGNWYGGFGSQGSYGGLWSSSAYSSYVDVAWLASFSSGYVNPGDTYGVRSYGFGVRCLLS